MLVVSGLAIGMIIGFIEGVVLYAIPEDPFHRRVLLPATIKGALVGLIVGLLVRPGNASLGILLGALGGLLFNRLSLLREGGAGPKEAAYVMPISIVAGAVTGLLTALI